MFFILAARRTKRVIACLGKAAVRGLAAAGLVSFCAAVVCRLFTDTREIALSDAIMYFSLLFFAGTAVFFGFELKKYGMKIFHRYDEDIIGSAFTGLDHKSRMFEDGVHTFHSGDFRGALDIFTDLDAEKLPLTDDEQGVLSFYRGRCYQIMGIYPNAAANYETAVKHGFKLAEMPLFLARCYSSMGDTNRAVELLKGILDSDHQYSRRARYEIGSIYLRLSDDTEALKWFNEAIEKHECYAEALGGAAICYSLRKDFKKGEEYFKMAIVNNIENPEGFTSYYKEVQASVILGGGSAK